jgi:plastocyanin
VKNIVRIFVFALLLVAAFSFAVVKGESNYAVAQAAPGEVEVKIDNFSFPPQSLSVSPGTKVTWKNRDDIPHTVVSTEGVSSLVSWIPTRRFLSRLISPEPMPISARSIRK